MGPEVCANPKRRQLVAPKVLCDFHVNSVNGNDVALHKVIATGCCVNNCSVDFDARCPRVEWIKDDP